MNYIILQADPKFGPNRPFGEVATGHGITKQPRPTMTIRPVKAESYACSTRNDSPRPGKPNLEVAVSRKGRFLTSRLIEARLKPNKGQSAPLILNKAKPLGITKNTKVLNLGL